MKITSEINGQKVIYVQAIDIQKINELNLLGAGYSVPSSIWGKSFIENAQIFNNPDRKREYIKFDKQHELYFFEQKEFNFILDYNFLNSLSDESILNKIDKCRNRLNSLKNSNNEVKIVELQYMIETLSYIFDLRVNNKKLPLPSEVENLKQPEPTGFQKFINLFTGK